MKVSDYIINFLVERGVHDIFGYSGGVVCHLIDSAFKTERMTAHTNYHEQAAAFAACAYGQATGIPGVAFATSGPGATNLVTGIANAYFDSAPAIYLTGQVDTYSLKTGMSISQRGFQETDIVSMVKSITKYAVQVQKPDQICYELEKAWFIATTCRKGPVLLDLPADVQRGNMEPEQVTHFHPPVQTNSKRHIDALAADIVRQLIGAKRPCILVGNAVKQNQLQTSLRCFAESWGIPVVSSMNAVDILPSQHPLFMGFIGTNGHRCANMAVAKCDLLLSLGSRLDLKQVGDRISFAAKAKLIRVDIDKGELSYKVHADEQAVYADLTDLLPALNRQAVIERDGRQWLEVCASMKQSLLREDCTSLGHRFLMKIAPLCDAKTVFTLDVGHNEVWSAQALEIQEGQSVYLSGGLGAMGYSLPAAIGIAYTAATTVVSICGDGGLQMNIQELQVLAREQLNIKVLILNNHSLGMIRHFQEANFEERYTLTTADCGYTVPDFGKLANAYGLPYVLWEDLEKPEPCAALLRRQGPAIIECKVDRQTRLYPKFGKPPAIENMEPLIDQARFQHLMEL